MTPRLLRRNSPSPGRCWLFSVLVVSVSGFSGCYLDTSPAGPDVVSLQLADLLNDKDPVVRRTAAESLGKIGSSSQIERVVQTLSDPDPRVREAGVVALGRLEVEADGVPAIAQALSDTAGPVRAAAARSLGEVGDVSGVANRLIRLLKDPDSRKRRAAVQALVQVEVAGAFSQLSLAVRDDDAIVRQGAVAALGEWWGEKSIPLLRERLAEDAVPGVRVEAAYRLGKVGHHGLVQELDHVASTDRDVMVRRWAQWASGRLKGPPDSG